MLAMAPSSECSRARACSALTCSAAGPAPAPRPAAPAPPSAMRSRFSAGPRSAYGRIARLSEMRMVLSGPCQCAGHAGNAGMAQRRHGSPSQGAAPGAPPSTSGSPTHSRKPALGVARVVQARWRAAQLVFKEGRGHGNAALNLRRRMLRILRQIQRAIEQQVLPVGNRGSQRLARSGWPPAPPPCESIVSSAARLEGSTAPGS